MIVGELLAFEQLLIGGFIEDYVPFSINGSKHFANSVSSPLAFVYAILAVIAMFYPLGGFLADVYCGRFKMVMIGLGFLVFSFSSLIVILVWIGIQLNHFKPLLQEYDFKEVAPFYFIGFSTLYLATLGIVAFQANFIQLGLDQLMDSPSRGLSIFIHLAIWANVLGTTLVAIGGALAECPTVQIKVRVAWNVLPILILFSIPFLLIFTCCKRQWFYSEPGHRNPYRNVLKVLNFARKHKYPLQRSAFTYCDDERPSRVDFAKSRYGGPFTTEQVEDVKAFLQILTLLLSLGATFVMEVPTSYIGFKTFGLHTGNISTAVKFGLSLRVML
jgi:peptide/histidine transporter 3/4